MTASRSDSTESHPKLADTSWYRANALPCMGPGGRASCPQGHRPWDEVLDEFSIPAAREPLLQTGLVVVPSADARENAQASGIAEILPAAFRVLRKFCLRGHALRTHD